MSLINDALKQTKEAQSKTPPPVPPPLTPVESKRPSSSGWLVTGIIVLVLAVATIYTGFLLSKPARLAASAAPVAALSPAVRPLPVATETLKIVPTVAVPPGIISNATSNVGPEVVVPPRPVAPKLQGILFATIRPCAIVNGRTVFVGDHINEFRVAAVSRNSVTLQNGMETEVLSLSPR